MCGIVACKLKRPLESKDIAIMRDMRDALSHRGPDDQGEFIDAANGLFLGHRRLSIIDLDQRSAQPMHRDHLVITYNGEVYNYVEIAETLGIDHTNLSDTAIILEAWKKWERGALDQFDGMYAFALWDKHAQSLTIVTDVFGEKPLYQYENEEGYYFCSELGPLADAFDLAFEPSQNDISDFLYLGYIRPPHTGYQGVTNIAPASIINLSSDNQYKKIKYWTAPEPYIGLGKVQPIPDQSIDEIKDILCTSLERRLRADVPIGLFLSGGVDSALVAALASKELGRSLETYTVSFPDGTDESQTAAIIAQHLGLNNTIINSRESALWKNAPVHLADLYGAPNDNMTALAVYQMCLEAKSYLTVALSGLGGDELFYGYNKYATLYRFKALYHSAPYARSFAKIGAFFPFLKSKSNLILKLMQGHKTEQYLRLKNNTIYEEIKTLCGDVPKNFLGKNARYFVHDVRMFDIEFSMPQSYIPAIDRGSMRASVEVRTPFLNRDLFSYITKLDQRALIAFGQKDVLKRLLSRYMPLDLLHRGKQGFVYPAQRYYTEIEPSAPNLSFFNQADIKKVWRKKADHNKQQLMVRLSVLEALSERHT